MGALSGDMAQSQVSRSLQLFLNSVCSGEVVRAPFEYVHGKWGKAMSISIRSVGVAAAGFLVSASAFADYTAPLTSLSVAAPAALGFSNSTSTSPVTLQTGTTVTPLPGGPTYNFLDSWTFTLAGGADVGGFTGTFNFIDSAGAVIQGISNLQMRLVGPIGPNLPAPVIVAWASVVLPVTSTSQQVFSIVQPTTYAPGNYSVDVRGTLVGAASYSGTLNLVTPVPAPASWALMALGMAGLAGFTQSRRRGSATSAR
jgi:hypothetical protein